MFPSRLKGGCPITDLLNVDSMEVRRLSRPLNTSEYIWRPIKRLRLRLFAMLRDKVLHVKRYFEVKRFVTTELAQESFSRRSTWTFTSCGTRGPLLRT